MRASWTGQDRDEVAELSLSLSLPLSLPLPLSSGGVRVEGRGGGGRDSLPVSASVSAPIALTGTVPASVLSTAFMVATVPSRAIIRTSTVGFLFFIGGLRNSDFFPKLVSRTQHRSRALAGCRLCRSLFDLNFYPQSVLQHHLLFSSSFLRQSYAFLSCRCNA